MSRIFVILFLFVMSAPSSADIKRVSLIQLVADPEEYLGEHVAVYGHFSLGIGARLFLSEEHAKAGDIASSIVVVDKSRNGEIIACDSMPVYVYAVFDKHNQQYSLAEVERIEVVNNEACFKATVK